MFLLVSTKKLLKKKRLFKDFIWNFFKLIALINMFLESLAIIFHHDDKWNKWRWHALMPGKIDNDNNWSIKLANHQIFTEWLSRSCIYLSLFLSHSFAFPSLTQRARGSRLKVCVLDDPRLDIVFVIVVVEIPTKSKSRNKILLNIFIASYSVQGHFQSWHKNIMSMKNLGNSFIVMLWYSLLFGHQELKEQAFMT